MYTAGSLFSGIGGIDLAFSRAGFDIRWQVEIEPFCRAVLTKHSAQYWPNAVQHEDVKNVGRHNLEAVDVIFGGFPCQDISVAGKGAGIKEGTRSGLWFEFARIIGELQPKFVLLENVPIITGRGADVVLGQLSSMGYDAEWGVIPASAVGAPHERERWWCVACCHSTRQLQQEGMLSHIRGRVEYSSEEMGISEPSGLQRIAVPKMGESSKPASPSAAMEIALCQRQPPTEQNSKEAPTNPVGESSVGITQSILGRAINGLSRQLDCNRWPANQGRDQYQWEAPRTIQGYRGRADRLKALGNAVVPQVVQPFAEAIYSFLKEADSATSAA